MKRMRWLALLAIFGLVAAACSAAEEAADTATDAVEDGAAAVEEAVTDDDGGEEADESDDATEEEPEEMAPEVLTDFGVTEDVIRVGASADLTGDFRVLTNPIMDAQQAYFDELNANGGIDGRMVELVVIDSGYDVPTHIDNYERLAEESEDGVVLISQSTGSPTTSAIAQDLVDDDLIAVPLAWYSGWADQDFGANVFELYTNYCFESMNGIEFLAEQSGIANPTVGIVTTPGEYGQDGAAGAKIAAEALGLEVVYDGEGLIAGDDFTAVVAGLVGAQPDIVWIAAGPTTAAQIVAGSFVSGLQAIWSGNSPSYNPAILASEAAAVYDLVYFHSNYTALWNSNESAGMQNMVEVLTERLPEGTYAVADAYIVGWTEAMFTEAVLRQASANGDLTRAGVVAAANEVTVDFQGLAPDQTWVGDPNDFAVRASSIFDLDLASATLATPITEDGSSGAILLAEDYVGSVAAGYEFTEPCFISEG